MVLLVFPAIYLIFGTPLAWPAKAALKDQSIELIQDNVNNAHLKLPML